jgi:lysophospholipid hydrolase
VHAGDLHSSTGQHQENIRLTRTISHINTPHIGPLDDSPRNGWLSGDEFDLKDEVMACIAKSIGLLQPSLSGSISGEVSPAVTASEIKRSSSAFNSTFSSLSLLDQRDDGSSITGASTASSTDYMNGLDNKVEILFFPAGSTLVHAGEVNTGKDSPSFGL